MQACAFLFIDIASGHAGNIAENTSHHRQGVAELDVDADGTVGLPAWPQNDIVGLFFAITARRINGALLNVVCKGHLARQVAFAYDVQQSTVDATGSYSEE